MNTPQHTPGAPPPPYTLDLGRKRQAALYYYATSMAFLEDLLVRVQRWIALAEGELDAAEQDGRDLLIANPRWGVRDTAANWGGSGYPLLISLREGLIKDIALRDQEIYRDTYVNGTLRGMSEFSMLWASPALEDAFEAMGNEISHRAALLDMSVERIGRPAPDDFDLYLAWKNDLSLELPRLPAHRVRTDIVGESGQRPPRTGVYVPQDDPYGALQFAWTGNDRGNLRDCATFNALGLAALRAAGRRDLWRCNYELLRFAIKGPPHFVEQLKQDKGNYEILKERTAPSLIAASAFTQRPCKWYFVEPLPGEYDDEPEPPPPGPYRGRGLPGQRVPRTGYWRAVALSQKDQPCRLLQEGERFPGPETTPSGQVIWGFDADEPLELPKRAPRGIIDSQ